MTLHQVAQYASDLARARAFYEKYLGATFIAEFTPPGLLFMNVGNCRVLFEEKVKSPLLYFRLSDVKETTELLRRDGVVIETEPHVIFQDTEGMFGPAQSEEHMAFFRDSEQNLVGLVSVHPIVK